MKNHLVHKALAEKINAFLPRLPIVEAVRNEEIRKIGECVKNQLDKREERNIYCQHSTIIKNTKKGFIDKNLKNFSKKMCLVSKYSKCMVSLDKPR